jgi:hypothetical protein
MPFPKSHHAEVTQVLQQIFVSGLTGLFITMKGARGM